MEILDKNGLSILWSKIKTKFGNYLPLTGGTMTGILYADSAIIARGRGTNKGYQGYFNNSNYALIGGGTHIFGGGKAQGDNALSFGSSSFAGIRNQDPDKDTYPYLALQPMNTQPIEVNTTTSSLGGGIFYGYPLLGGEVVEYSTPDGGLFTYENTSNRTQILLLVKNSNDKKLIFAGTPDHANLRDICYILFSNGYPSFQGEKITQVKERTIGDTTYYEVILYTNMRSTPSERYDFKTQNQFYCITKVNNTNLSGASSYRSGYQAMAFNYNSYAIGGYSIALGMNSWATNFVSLAMGYMSKAVNRYSIAMSSLSLASGENSITLGYNSVASGSASISMGASSLASGKNSITFGANSHAKNSYTTVFAYYGISSQDYQSVFGKYNKPEDAALIVGGGTGTSDAARKNIFKVDWSGNVTGKYFSGYSSSVGGEGFKIYPENSNQINFGGTGSDTTIIFGAASKDNRSVPTTYKFGANGDATIQASSFSGNAATATKLGNATVGSTNTPIYINGGTANSVSAIKESLLTYGTDNSSFSGKVSPIDMGVSNLLSANRIAFGKPDGVTIEYSTDGGENWLDYGATDEQKTNLISGLGQDFYIGGPDKSTAVSTLFLLRITLNALKLGTYTRPLKALIKVGTNGATSCKVDVQSARLGNPTSFSPIGIYDISGGSAWNSIPLGSEYFFGGGPTQISNNGVFRFTFSIGAVGSSDSSRLAISQIAIYGETDWITPSEMARTGHIYAYDAAKNVTFPSQVKAPKFNGALIGNASTASQLATPRTLTIGNTGKTFDGTADVSWSLDEIGAKDENVKFTTSADNVDYRLTAIGQRIAGNVEGTNSVVTADGITMNPSTGAVKAKSFEASKYLQGLVKNSAESKVADVTGQNVFSTYGGGTGTYSNIFGVNSYAGYNNGRTDKPYTYMNMYNTEQITVNGNSCYAYEVSPSETVNFTYNGIGYSYSNGSSILTCVMCVVKGTDIVANHSHNALKRVGFIFNNYKQTLKTNYITWTELIDDVDAAYLIVVNQFNSTKQNYDFSTVCNIFLATAGTNSNFKGDRANVFGYDSLCGSSGIIFGSSNTNVNGAVFGAYNNVLGVASYVFGQSNHTGPYSSYNTIFGNDCYCGGNYSNLLGVGLINMAVQYQTIIGKYNLPTNDAFMIGWGSSATDRKNIFKVDQSGNVTGKYFSGYSSSVGGEGFKIYPENSNEINFGGTGSSPIIVFGASSKDSRAVPTIYKFGANGDAVLMGGVFTGVSKSANMLDTARTLTIGNTGKTFDGSGNVSWTLDEIGAKDENVKYTTSVDNVDYRLTAIGQRIAGNVEGVNSVVTAEGITMNPSTGNLKATSFTGSLIGNAATATKLKTPQNLWGNSFDGSGSVSGDLKFVADGLTSEVSHGMRIGSTYGGFIGFSQILGKDGVGVFTGISLGWGANPETDAASVRINATTFTYKSYPILHSNNFSDYAPTKTGEGASGTWGISISGNADTATALTSSAGSSTQPIYFSNGKPVACSYTLGKSVPSNAVFTDTTYSVATASADGLMSAAMFKAQMVKSVGVQQGEAMMNPDGTITITDHSVYITQNKSNITGVYQTASGDNDVQIPNATTDYDGSMSYADKRKLDSFKVDTSTNYYMGNVVRINGNYMLPPSATITDLKDYAPIYGTIADHLELKNGISSDKIPEMIRLSIHNITYMFSLNTIDYTNNQIVYVCPYVQVQFTINSSTSQFVIEGFNPI